jgi:hypothetical protein
VLLSYQGLRDEITGKIEEARSRLERGEMTAEEMGGLLSDLLLEREMIVEEIDDLREARYGWASEAYEYSNSMKLRLGELDEETYNRLEFAASRLHVGVGRLLNEMMGKVLEKRDEAAEGIPAISSKDLSHLYEKRKASVKISHVGDLMVTREDLEEMGPRVKFSHVRSLEFDPSVGERLFHEKVKNISHCGLVRFPENFPKLLAYAKSSFCDYYEFTTPPEAGQ